MILDIGCGTGLSGQACEKAGHFVVGMDISQDMLGAKVRPEHNIPSNQLTHSSTPLLTLEEVGRDRGVHKGMQDTFKADMGSGLLFR